MKPEKRTTVQFSITVNSNMVRVADAVLRPSCMLTLPKGTYSTLFTELLGEWLARHTGVDLLDVIETAQDNPGAKGADLLALIAAKRKEVPRDPCSN